MNDQDLINRLVIMREILELQSDTLDCDSSSLVDTIVNAVLEKESFHQHECNILKKNIANYINELERTISVLENIDLSHPEDNVYHTGVITGRLNAFKCSIKLAKKIFN